jgi:hypothetical protein
MDCVRVSVSRFTYVPDEYYNSADAAFVAKPLAEWINVTPKHLPMFALAIDKTPQRVIMKCLDGRDVVVPSTPFHVRVSGELMETGIMGLVCYET